jgi:LPXTG-motif cell wall-anchored protein
LVAKLDEQRKADEEEFKQFITELGLNEVPLATVTTTEPKTDVPKTGDSALWLILFNGSLLGLGALAVTKRKEETEN